ncbi:MAG: TPR domain-containing protein, partial [Anaerolineae bacterium]
LLIMLQRRTVGEETEPHRWTGDLLRGLGMGVGSLALLAALGGGTYLLTLLSQDVLGWSANIGLYVGGGLMLLVFGGLWLYFVVERKGWRWLWIGWATIGVVAAIGLLAINLPGPLKDRVGAVSSLKRMTTILEWDTGTGRVRTLIWEGAMDLIMPHEPIEYPDGSKDTFNAVRPLIGYGPEAMYVGYNSFYPPLLGHYESRNASPDRSHNETLDSVVITGVFGLAAYLFLFGSFFYWCLHWLGLIRGRRQFWLYVALISVISLALFIAFALMDRLYFFAVAIPIGVVAGTTLYIIGRALSTNMRAARTPEITESLVHPHSVLLIAIFSSVLAHFVEINFGIAIAATRTTFWALAGMLVVLGLQWLPAEEVTLPSVLGKNEKTSSRNSGSSRRRSRRPRSRGSRVRRNSGRWVAAVVSLSLAATFLLGTLAYDFITNPDRMTEGSQVFWRSFTEIYTQGRRSYGALMIVVFTWLLFGVVGLGELDREGLFEEDRSRQWWVAVLTYVGLSLFGFLIVGSTLAGFHARLPQIQVTTVEGLVEVATILSGVLGQYYGLIFTVAILLAFVLMWEVPGPRSSLEPVSLLLLPVLLFLGVLLIRNYSYDLIRADIVFKQGTSFANSSDPNQKQMGIKHFDQAIEFAPREDYYRLFLGKAYLETAQTLPPETDVAQRERIFQVAEEVLHEAREIAPLNTDHSANLARFYNILVSFAEGPQERQALYEKSEENYRKALALSPNNAVLWNELARLKITQGDEVGFRETISHSLALDPEFEQTWALLGEVRLNQQDLPGAIEAYEKAVAFKPKDCQLRHTLGSLLVQEGRWDDAATALEPILDRCPRMGRVWDVYRLLAISYFYQGRQGAALQMASQSLQLVPEDQRHIVEQLIAAIEQPQPVEPVEPQPAEPESTEPSEP